VKAREVHGFHAEPEKSPEVGGLRAGPRRDLPDPSVHSVGEYLTPTDDTAVGGACGVGGWSATPWSSTLALGFSKPSAHHRLSQSLIY